MPTLSAASTARILREYKQIRSALNANLHPTILSLEPDSLENLSNWTALLKPTSTAAKPYTNHTFKLYLTLPPDYPHSPPQVHFAPRTLPHVNVDFETGAVCLDILKSEAEVEAGAGAWRPVYTLLYVCESTVRLLEEPNAESPLNLELGTLLRQGDVSAYVGLINYYLSECAGGKSLA